MDRRTVEVYEARGAEWVARREAKRLVEARALAERARPGSLRVDLGCGPGWHLAALGPRAIGLDAAGTMLGEARRRAPGALLVRADLEALPFARGALGAAWARNSYVHVPRAGVPFALAQLHSALEPDAPVALELFGGSGEGSDRSDELFPGRLFSFWERDELADLLLGAGFAVEGIDALERPDRFPVWMVRARRLRTLPDLVGPGMRLLVCGLNPSLVSADTGVPFFRAGNRFWPAAVAADLALRARDPLQAFRARGLGFTDIVKRATARADELGAHEYRAGLARVERLVRWLAPRAVCFVGLAGFRAALERRARAGIQPAPLGGRPVYLMPSTSGAAASSSLADLTAHLRAAAALADAAA